MVDSVSFHTHSETYFYVKNIDRMKSDVRIKI